jgi:Tfp pilus assembly pilus retraction ATPase PilT
MGRLYTLNSLLEHLLREGASELHLSSERPPQVIIKDEEVAVGRGGITNDNIAELLYNMATVDQMKELHACGDARFIYLFRNWARFGVTASVAHNNTFSIKIRNLGR